MPESIRLLIKFAEKLFIILLYIQGTLMLAFEKFILVYIAHVFLQLWKKWKLSLEN